MNKPKFTEEQVKEQFQDFVLNHFLNDEENVQKKEIMPNHWAVSVADKEFSVTVELESNPNGYGFTDHFAVVTEPDGEKANYLLFEDEKNKWLEHKRKEKGLE